MSGLDQALPVLLWQALVAAARGDVLSVVSQGLGRLSLVAQSAAQSAASAVQVGTKEITSKVREGGYDQKVNETVSVVTARTTEIGHKTWGLVKGVMALASRKVEEYAKEGGMNWNNDNSQRNDSERNGYYQEFNKQEKNGHQASSGGHSSQNGNSNSYSSSSWDDWDVKDKEKPKRGTSGITIIGLDGMIPKTTISETSTRAWCPIKFQRQPWKDK
ncbi:hypothetical protein MLD38_026500 [Melastoma candidum]|uniref:Uncharacterized protein n=1 Tax=Melastoma candidum TaxID=119954 RepID=A0ACB9P1M2_9MYRT|nr:hypothetical protein MLD38_026500 [Melastoma candidum]